MADSFITLPDGTKLQSDAITVSTNTVHRQKGYILDGADEATGAKSDAAYSGGGAGSVIAILKGLYTLLTGTLTIKRAVGTTTKTSYTVTTTSGQAIAANAVRKSLRIVNPATNTATVYLEFGTTAAATTSATYLAPGDYYYETETGDRVNAIVASGTQTITIYEVA